MSQWQFLGRADRVRGIHFFNPALVMQVVELIPSLTTSAETHDRMQSFVSDTLRKQPIEATDAADIDKGMVLGCGHPVGPLALADLIGLDTIRAIGMSLYDEFKEPLYSPPPLLERMVDAGLLGRKSGHGFYPC